ncbi:MAG: Imm50 family immunity protein [Aestuariivirga sp.]
MIESFEKLEAVYRSLPGGPELFAWFGKVPSFHDAEIVSCHLNRRAPSHLRIYTWVGDGSVDEKMYFKQLHKAVVTFELHEIVFLQLDGFSQQNVIGDLDIRRAAGDPRVLSYYDFNTTDDDFELHLDPCYGMDGMIRCRGVVITYVPGEPEDKLIRHK